MLECLSLRTNWLPSYASKCTPPPPDPKGGGNTRFRVRGRGKPVALDENLFYVHHDSIDPS
jgi:hypothetical protein